MMNYLAMKSDFLLAPVTMGCSWWTKEGTILRVCIGRAQHYTG